MPSLLVFGMVETAGGPARQVVIDIIEKVAEYAKKNEDNTRKFVITVPKDEADDSSVILLQEYTSPEALDEHLASPALAECMAALKAKPELLRKKAEFFVADVDSSFTRDNITEVSDPFIAYAIVEYKDNTIDEALKGWRRVTEESEENETDTFAYAIGRCKDKENVVRTLEVYASEKYFREVHCRGNAVAENRAKYGPEIRVAFKAHLLRLVGGWFRGNSSA